MGCGLWVMGHGPWAVSCGLKGIKMRILYDIFFIVFSVFYLPYFLIKRKYHKDFLQRFGIFDKDMFSHIAPTKPIWLHAVSVGEMKTAESLITKMRTLFPAKHFVISNTTQTGHEIATSIVNKEDVVIYFPMDLSFVVHRLIELINPSLFIAIETEIWPNLVTELATKNIPIVLMNGRISPASFNNYRLIRPIIRSILRKTTLFCMRTERDAERIKELGAPADRVKVSGNMKFDSIFIKDENEMAKWPPVKNRNLWLKDESKLIIAGSTHHGEDERILQSYKKIKRDYPDLTLLLAPRHIERVNEINAQIEQSGFNAVKISEVEKRCAATAGDITTAYDGNSVFILDSIGRLSALYKLATVVFMGGSLIPHGGHNFIEPACYAKPMLTGPYVHNFKDICELLKSKDAIEIVHNNNELASSLRRLLTDEDRRKAMGERARKIVIDNIGSTDRNIELIRPFL